MRRASSVGRGAEEAASKGVTIEFSDDIDSMSQYSAWLLGPGHLRPKSLLESTHLASISGTPFLSSVALMACIHAFGSDPSGKTDLRLSLGPTMIPVAGREVGGRWNGIRRSDRNAVSVFAMLRLPSIRRGSAARVFKLPRCPSAPTPAAHVVPLWGRGRRRQAHACFRGWVRRGTSDTTRHNTQHPPLLLCIFGL